MGRERNRENATTVQQGLMRDDHQPRKRRLTTLRRKTESGDIETRMPNTYRGPLDDHEPRLPGPAKEHRTSVKQGSEFARLDKLDGAELEAAVAKMSPEQQERWLQAG